MASWDLNFKGLIQMHDSSVEMTEEQQNMFDKLTRLRKGVALATLRGLTPTEAHREGGGKAKNESHRSRLAGEILLVPAVKAFLDSFKVERLKSTIMSRDEMLERLSVMARADISDVLTAVDSNDEFMNTETGDVVSGKTLIGLKPIAEMTRGDLAGVSEILVDDDGYKFKFKPKDQREAMKQLSELMGYDAPTKTEVTIVKTLGDFYE